ncbi:MAG: argininosuccinate lyase [Candidatus Bathyarchaeia archaeon]
MERKQRVSELEKGYHVMGERLKERTADAVIEYYQKQEPPVTPFDALIAANKAHMVMLVETGIIDRRAASAILKAILELEKLGQQRFQLDPYLVDLYMNMEAFVVGKLGEEIGGKIHTARSRNDLEPTVLRIASRAALNETTRGIIELRESLIRRAREHVETIMPGYTHMQHAQPITLGHYLVGAADMLERDVHRLEEAYKRTNLSPLGSGALATTGFPIDRQKSAELLGFDALVENSLDGVSSRDFAQETVAALSILLTNLSRFAMDLILWSTYEYGMVELAEAYSSISSIMPQKKNPVMAEAIRASASRVYGQLERIQTVLRALPQGISRDIGETDVLLDALGEASSIIRVTTGITSTLIIKSEVMKRRAGEGFSTATELADVIVRERGLSFRTAHRIVGTVVRRAMEKGKETEYITTETIDAAAVEVAGKPLGLEEKTILEALDPYENVKRRRVTGGPAPPEVMRMIEDRLRRIGGENLRLEARMKRLEDAEKRLFEAVSQITESPD